MKRGLSFLIPYYNKGSGFNSFLDLLGLISDSLKRESILFEFIIFNDGSDAVNTHLLDEFVSKHAENLKNHLHVHHRNENRGKGATLFEASQRAQYLSSLWLDADLAFSKDDILKMASRAYENPEKIFIANRKKSQSKGLSPLRKFASRAFRRFCAHLLGLPLNDIQAGLKAMPTQWFRSQTWINKRFGLDIEVLYLAHKEKIEIIEVPVDLVRYEENSTVRIFHTTIDLLVSLFKTLRRR